MLALLGIGRAQIIAGLIAAGLSLAALGAGYVWGTTTATRAAMAIANDAANARVAALDKSYHAIITDYADRLNFANAVADQLTEKLRSERERNAGAAAAAKEKLTHVTDANLDRPVPVAVLDLLREQPARH